MEYKQGLILIGNRVYEFEISPIKTIIEEYGKFNGKFYRTITKSSTLRILRKKIEIGDYFELFSRCVKYPYDPTYVDIDKRDRRGEVYYNANKKLFAFTSQGECTTFTEEYILDFIENDKI